MNPSPLAYAALLLIIPFTAAVFSLMRPARAFSILMVAAVLLLPERVQFDAPGIPPLDKTTLTCLCALVAVAITQPRGGGAARPAFWPWMLAGVGILGAVLTVATNSEPIPVGAASLPGLRPYDAFTYVGRAALQGPLQYFLARALIRTKDDVEDVLGILAVATLLYLPLIAFELVMSPQLHRIVYGFHQHDFNQTLRGGGYRPMVFMAHGLALAMFVLWGTIAGFALAAARSKRLRATRSLGCVLAATLVLMKSLGALLYGAAVVIFQKLLRDRVQRTLLVASCLIVLTYPATRATGLFPVDRMLSIASSMSDDRSKSLEFRFYNEDLLLERAMAKPWFGWGGFGRNRIYNESGDDVSVTDGAWIIVLGEGGLAGFACTFGLMVYAVLAAVRTSSRMTMPDERALLLGLAWIVAIGTLDLLPNGLFSSMNLFLAGSLAGVSSGLLGARATPQAVDHRNAQVPRRS